MVSQELIVGVDTSLSVFCGPCALLSFTIEAESSRVALVNLVFTLSRIDQRFVKLEDAPFAKSWNFDYHSIDGDQIHPQEEEHPRRRLAGRLTGECPVEKYREELVNALRMKAVVRYRGGKMIVNCQAKNSP